MISVIGPDGKRYKSVAAICAEYGISRQLYSMRIASGWDKDKAVLYKAGSADAVRYAAELRKQKKAEGSAQTPGRKPVFVKSKTDNAYTLPVKGFIW